MPLAIGQFPHSLCMAPLLGRIVGTEPELRGCEQHPI